MSEQERFITNVLYEMGAQVHLLGFPMTIEAVMYVLETGMYKKNLTRQVYREVGLAFDRTSADAERSIRSFKERLWTKGNLDTIYKYFGNTIEYDRDRPTNIQFIYTLANLAMVHMLDM